MPAQTKKRNVYFVAARLLSCAAALFMAMPGVAAETILEDAARETPECVSWGEGRIDCLIRMKTGRLSWLVYANSRWSKPRDLGGDLSGPPVCVVRGPLGINCFARAETGGLQHIYLNGSVWSRWQTLPGKIAPEAPSCAASARDRVSCFARGMDGLLQVKAWYGDLTWQAWRSLSGAFFSAPSCVALSLDRYACFARSEKGRLAAWLPAAKGPGGSIGDLGLEILGNPSCEALGQDEAMCLARAKDGQLVEWRGSALAGAKQDRSSQYLGGVLKGDPICGAVKSGVIVCVYLGGDEMLWRRAHTAQGWSDAVNLEFAKPAYGRCTGFGAQQIACFAVDEARRLTAAILPHDATAIVVASSEVPSVEANPVVPAPGLQLKPEAAEAAVASAPKAVGVADVKDPFGDWYFFEQANGQVCRVHLSSEQIRADFRLVQDTGCARLPVMRRVDRWNLKAGTLLFRNERRKAFFAFKPAGPAALVSRGRKSELALLARDPSVFQIPVSAGAASVPTKTDARKIDNSLKGFTGSWRVAAGRRVVCRLGFSAAGTGGSYNVTGARACGPGLAHIRAWRIHGDRITLLSSTGAAVARFDYVRGTVWRGRIQGARGLVTLIQP
jgi:hypothetical protein